MKMVPLCAARILPISVPANFGPKITTLTNNRENGRNMDIKMCFFNGKCQTGIEALESMYTLTLFLSLSLYICVYMTILIRRIVTLKPS